MTAKIGVFSFLAFLFSCGCGQDIKPLNLPASQPIVNVSINKPVIDPVVPLDAGTVYDGGPCAPECDNITDGGVGSCSDGYRCVWDYAACPIAPTGRNLCVLIGQQTATQAGCQTQSDCAKGLFCVFYEGPGSLQGCCSTDPVSCS